MKQNIEKDSKEILKEMLGFKEVKDTFQREAAGYGSSIIPLSENKTEEKEERGLENKFVELIHDCKPFSETIEGCVKIAKEYAACQSSPSDQKVKELIQIVDEFMATIPITNHNYYLVGFTEKLEAYNKFKEKANSLIQDNQEQI